MPISLELFPPSILREPIVSMAALQESGLPLEETTYLTVGGGMGSFTWVDHLLIHGVDRKQIVAIGPEPEPYARFRRLCRNSQVGDDDRLRSDSSSRPDNIWGWPGFALQEIAEHLRRGRWRPAFSLLWQIFTEPVLSEPFSPQAGQLYAAIDREMRRIGWNKIWRFGRVEAVRKTDDGRYAIAYRQTRAGRSRPKLILARYVHLAVGYPGVRLLPELRRYRQQTGDRHHFVNAYEPHEHVYDRLRRRGGTVLLRGRGITASQIIQRLYEERCHNPNITLLHLMRSPRPVGPRYQYARRRIRHHVDRQAYNFPKACFGGDLRFIIEAADDRQRARLIDLWGGPTTTADRPAWRQMVETGLKEGWYQIRFGCLSTLEPDGNGLTAVIDGRPMLKEEIRFRADYVIDATGLDPSPDHHPLWGDLLPTYCLPKNGKGHVKVSNLFEIVPLRNGTGAVYASGIATLGGPFAPVDSFLGLQYAAQQSMASLLTRNAPGVHRLNPIRSTIQWLRWAAGVKP